MTTTDTAIDTEIEAAPAHVRTYEVRTFGCQMNVHDSERLSGLLEDAGYVRAADGDLHAWPGGLDRREVAEVPVQLVVGVLTHGTSVEHDHVGVLAFFCLRVAGGVQQARDPLGVVHVHLAAVGAHLVRALMSRLLPGLHPHGRNHVRWR